MEKGINSSQQTKPKKKLWWFRLDKKEDWRKKWCRHCRCDVRKENLPIKYEVIVRNIKTKKERTIDKVCENCVHNGGYNEIDCGFD